MSLFTRRIGPTLVIAASLAYIVVMLIVLKRRPVLLGLFQAVTFGILLVFIWRTDKTAGLVPTLFTVAFAFSVYDAVVALRRELKAKQRTADSVSN